MNNNFKLGKVDGFAFNLTEDENGNPILQIQGNEKGGNDMIDDSKDFRGDKIHRWRKLDKKTLAKLLNFDYRFISCKGMNNENLDLVAIKNTNISNLEILIPQDCSIIAYKDSRLFKEQKWPKHPGFIIDIVADDFGLLNTMKVFDANYTHNDSYDIGVKTLKTIASCSFRIILFVDKKGKLINVEYQYFMNNKDMDECQYMMLIDSEYENIHGSKYYYTSEKY